MRASLTAAVLIGLCAPASVTAATAATPKACAVLSDPAGDVQAGDAAQAAVLPDGHLDVRSVDVRSTGTGLVFTIRDTALAEQRQGRWDLTFRGGRTTLFVRATLGEWANVGDGGIARGFRAGVVGQRATAVTGTFDYATSTITISVPRKAFGTALPARGAVLSRFAIRASETLADLAPNGVDLGSVELADTGSSATAYTVGARC